MKKTYLICNNCGFKTYLICKNCGFMTLDVSDMIKHLACIQKYKAENCITKQIILQEDKE